MVHVAVFVLFCMHLLLQSLVRQKINPMRLPSLSWEAYAGVIICHSRQSSHQTNMTLTATVNGQKYS